MSTLGTFSEYADFGILSDIEQARQRMEPGYADKAARKAKAKRIAANPIIQGINPERVQKTRYEGRRANIATKGSSKISRPSAEVKKTMPTMKVTKQSTSSKKAVTDSLAEIAKKKGLRMRNIGIGAGLGVASLGTLGAIAYNNRNSSRRSEMSFSSAFANFQATGYDPKTKKANRFGDVTPQMKAGSGRDLTQDELDKLKKVKDARKEGKFDNDQIKATQEKLKAYKGQRAIEKNVDAGGDVYKGAKGVGDYLSRTSALLTSPERKAIATGKASKNGFVKGLSEGAEKFGRAGYKTGATGLRGVGNALVGRTVTGKVARLGAAGIGLSAIGGAMKRNRQERG